MHNSDGLLTYSKPAGYQIRPYTPSTPREIIHLPYTWCSALEFVQYPLPPAVQLVYCVIPHPKTGPWATIRMRIHMPYEAAPNRAVNSALQHLEARLAPTAFIVWAREKLSQCFPEYQNQKQWRLYLKNLIAEWPPDTHEGREHISQTLRLGNFKESAFPRSNETKNPSNHA
jgi:hypothetical protein